MAEKKKIMVPGELYTIATDDKLTDAAQVKDSEWKGLGGDDATKADADQHAINEELAGGINEAKLAAADATSSASSANDDIANHVADKNNPHGVTAAQVGAFNEVSDGSNSVKASGTNQKITVKAGKNVSATVSAADNSITIAATTPDATSDASGLLSAADKAALDKLKKGTFPEYGTAKTDTSVDTIANDKAVAVVDSLSIKYDSAVKRITISRDGKQIGDAIDASDFVKDGVLKRVVAFNYSDDNVTVSEDGTATYRDKDAAGTQYVFSGVTNKSGIYLGFVWNTDAGDVDPVASGTQNTTAIDLRNFIKTYTAGDGIAIDGQKISLKIDSKDTWLVIQNGYLTTSGLDDLATQVDQNTTDISSAKDNITNLSKAITSAISESKGYTNARTGLQYAALTDAIYGGDKEVSFYLGNEDAQGNKASLEDGETVTDVHVYVAEGDTEILFHEITCQVVYPANASRPVGIPTVIWDGLDAPSSTRPIVITYRIVNAEASGDSGSSSGSSSGASSAEVTALATRVSSLETASKTHLTKDSDAFMGKADRSDSGQTLLARSYETATVGLSGGDQSEHVTIDNFGVTLEHIDENGKADISETLTAESVRKIAAAPLRIDRLEETEAIRQDYSSLPLLCGQPRLLFGNGTPAAGTVPVNWTQYDPLTDTGYNWNGLPSAIGQMYLDCKDGGGLYIASERDITNPVGDLVWRRASDGKIAG